MTNPLILTITLFSCATIKNEIDNASIYIEQDNGSIFWFKVVEHIYDPENIIFKNIDSAFEKFKPDVVLVEGENNERAKSLSEIEAKREGESRYTAYKAYINGIDVISIEPPVNNQIEYLLEHYDSESIYSMYLIRLLNSDRARYLKGSREIKDPYKNYGHYLSFLNSIANLNIEISDENIDAVIKKYTGFNFKDKEWYNIDYYPVLYEEQGGLFEVRNAVSGFRNIWLVRKIKELMDYKKRIFIVMGSGHVDETKQQIIELYKIK